MNPDDRFDAYFSDRAGDVPVLGLGSAAVVARARRRRSRRNGATVAAVLGVLAVGGAVVAQSADRGEQRVASGGNALAPSTLDWTLVTATAGLGASGASATTADGAVYDLSTAPGVPDPDRPTGPSQLYRSGDGTDWSPVALPDGLSPLGLAAGGDRVYAVGTAPAGGGIEDVELVAGAGDGAWTDVDVPLDLAAIGAGFPGRVRAIDTSVAAGPDGTVVVAVDVKGQLDGSALPEAFGDSWQVVPEGIEVVGSDCTAKFEELDAKGGETSSPTTAPAAPTTVPGADAPVTTSSRGGDPVRTDDALDQERAECAEGAADAAVVGVHPWSELGLSADEGQLAVGRTHLFATGPSGTLEPVAELSSGAWNTHLLGTPDGWWLVSEGVQPALPATSSRAIFSADGRTWSTEGALDVPGHASEVGLVAGRPAVASFRDADGRLLLSLLDPAGVRSVDVAAAMGDPSALTGYPDVAFGPLGFAALVVDDGGTADEVVRVVHTGDGADFATEEVPAAPAGRAEGARSVAVSADAITVRLNSYDAGLSFEERDGVAPDQRLFVGTPR